MFKILQSMVLFFAATVVYPAQVVQDVSQLAKGRVHGVYQPTTIEDVQFLLAKSKRKVAIAGGCFSQGGHVWVDEGIVIDMKRFNQVVHFDPAQKTITVQAGITWRDIQKYIDPHGLSIKVMQSYNDFTVGGSLSVNVHGRMLEYGALIETVESVKIASADGSVIVADRQQNYDLFCAAIGGYGAVGIILEATLSLTDNSRMEKVEATMLIEHYPAYFKAMVKNNPDVLLHNANIYTNSFSKVSSISWQKTDKPCTIDEHLRSPGALSKDFFAVQVARYVQPIQKSRVALDVMGNAPTVVWRNYEMSRSVATVEPVSRFLTTTVLQEYFVPCDQLCIFVQRMKEIVQKYNVNMMNVSIRYVHKDHESVMAYAQADESFALVCYINMGNNRLGIQKAERWTGELLEHLLACGGTYYLPYQLHASKQQFQQAYPRHAEFWAMKNKYDPEHRFMNSFLEKYSV